MFLLHSVAATTGISGTSDLASRLKNYMAECYPWLGGDCFWLVSTAEQRMYKVQDGAIMDSFVISSASRGIGCELNSFKTPYGLHQVSEKYGSGLPKGAILKNRVYTKRKAEIISDPIDTPHDHVTTRLLWLDGLEPGINRGGNVDSKERCIYIHGTPEEGLLGRRASEGCIRVANDDVILLYELMNVGDRILILPDDF